MMGSKDTPPPNALFEQLTTDNLLWSLRSSTCPACGRQKKSRQTFCGDCYYSLTKVEQADLWKPLDGGYDQAVGAAMRALKKTTFIMPKESRPRRPQTLNLFEKGNAHGT